MSDAAGSGASATPGAPVGPGAPLHTDGSASPRAGTIRVPRVVYGILRRIAHVICRVYWRVSVTYEAPVPEQGPVILAPVHRSFMDFFVVSEVTPRKIFYMAKDDLWRSKLLGAFLDSVGAFPVNRHGSDRAALATAQRILERGEVLVLFPEGTRRSGPVVQDVHEGAAFLAARTGAPVVPIGIGGTEFAMPKGSKMIRPVKVSIVVGAPLEPPARAQGGRVARSAVHAFSEQIRKEVQRLFDEAQRRAAGRSGSR